MILTPYAKQQRSLLNFQLRQSGTPFTGPSGKPFVASRDQENRALYHFLPETALAVGEVIQAQGRDYLVTSISMTPGRKQGLFEEVSCYATVTRKSDEPAIFENVPVIVSRITDQGNQAHCHVPVSFDIRQGDIVCLKDPWLVLATDQRGGLLYLFLKKLCR